MSYLEELLPEFRKGAKIRCKGWSKEKYIHFPEPETGEILDEQGKIVEIPFHYTTENFWEFYKEPEPDWQYIVDHECLCYFWNNLQGHLFMGKLEKFFIGEITSGFIDHKMTSWNYCRPVRRDEVTFYEDKKDENER